MLSVRIFCLLSFLARYGKLLPRRTALVGLINYVEDSKYELFVAAAKLTGPLVEAAFATRCGIRAPPPTQLLMWKIRIEGIAQ